MQRPDVHRHTCHREFLRAYLAWGRARRDPALRQKVVAERLGAASSGFLSNVLAGRKNLTPTQIRRLVEVLELSDLDAEYFEALVHHGQARDDQERRDWFERLARLRSVTLDLLPPEGLSLFARAEAVFLYELLTFETFDGDAEALARRFEPPTTAGRVMEAIALLERLHLVEKDPKGRWRARSQAVSSGPEPTSRELADFHRRAIALARRSLARIPQAERDLSVLTLGLSEDGFRQIKAEIAHFRRRLVAIALEETRPESVYQLNFHMVPVVRVREERP